MRARVIDLPQNGKQDAHVTLLAGRDSRQHRFEDSGEDRIIRGPLCKVRFEDIGRGIKRSGGIPELDGGFRVLATREVDGRAILVLGIPGWVLNSNGGDDRVHEGHEDVPLALIEKIHRLVGEVDGHWP